MTMMMATTKRQGAREARAAAGHAEQDQREYADITVGTWYNLTQVAQTLQVGRSQVSTMVENGVLHPKHTRMNRKIKVVAAAEVEEARRQLEAIKALREHMDPTGAARRPQARYLQNLNHTSSV